MVAHPDSLDLARHRLTALRRQAMALPPASQGTAIENEINEGNEQRGDSRLEDQGDQCEGRSIPQPPTRILVPFQRIWYDPAVADGVYTPTQLRRAHKVVKPWGSVQFYTAQWPESIPVAAQTATDEAGRREGIALQRQTRFWERPRDTEEENSMGIRLRASGGPILLPQAEYTATLAAIEEREGTKGPFLQWLFAVEDAGRTVNIVGYTSCDLAPTEKIWHFGTALLGRPPAADEVVDTDTLIGARCRVVVVVKAGTNGGSVNRVERVLPLQDTTPDDVPF